MEGFTTEMRVNANKYNSEINTYRQEDSMFNHAQIVGDERVLFMFEHSAITGRVYKMLFAAAMTENWHMDLNQQEVPEYVVEASNEQT